MQASSLSRYTWGANKKGHSKYGGPTTRIYTDYFSGNTDRVVWEFDAENLGKLEGIFWAAGEDPDYQKAFENWYEGMKPLIEMATVELWNKEN